MNKDNTPMNKDNTVMNKDNTPMDKDNTPMNKDNTPMDKDNTPMNKDNTNSDNACSTKCEKGELDFEECFCGLLKFKKDTTHVCIEDTPHECEKYVDFEEYFCGFVKFEKDTTPVCKEDTKHEHKKYPGINRYECRPDNGGYPPDNNLQNIYHLGMRYESDFTNSYQNSKICDSQDSGKKYNDTTNTNKKSEIKQNIDLNDNCKKPIVPVYLEEIPNYAQCHSCKNALADPVICGHHYYYCSGCICYDVSSCCDNHDIEKISSDPDDCTMMGHGFISNILAELKVKCLNHEYGCDWVGKRVEFSQHYKICKETFADCKLGCGSRINIYSDEITHTIECNNFCKIDSCIQLEDAKKMLQFYINFEKANDGTNLTRFNEKISRNVKNTINELIMRCITDDSENKKYDNMYATLTSRINDLSLCITRLKNENECLQNYVNESKLQFAQNKISISSMKVNQEMTEKYMSELVSVTNNNKNELAEFKGLSSRNIIKLNDDVTSILSTLSLIQNELINTV